MKVVAFVGPSGTGKSFRAIGRRSSSRTTDTPRNTRHSIQIWSVRNETRNAASAPPTNQMDTRLTVIISTTRNTMTAPSQSIASKLIALSPFPILLTISFMKVSHIKDAKSIRLRSAAQITAQIQSA